MDVKAMRTFHLIIKYGSFHRAAEELNYAQSTVTLQIQKLESDLGVQLIEREKKIRLTEAGRLFYDQSLQILKSMEQLQTNLSDFQEGEAGNIRLGVTEPTASYRLPRILKDFLSEFPKIQISIEISNTPTLRERMLHGDLDLALCSVPDDRADLYFEPLFQEEFVVLVPDHHPLAKKEVLTPHDLQGQRLLITSATCPYRKKLEMVLQETGYFPINTMEIGSMTALQYYVENGLGIALVPKISLRPVPRGTTTRTIVGHLVEMTFGILCKTSDYPMKLANIKLYQYLKKELLGENLIPFS